MAAGLIGAADEAALWEHAVRVYGERNVPYVIGFYRSCLCDGRRVELEWARHEEPAPVTEYNPRGLRVRLEAVRVWPAPGFVPVMTRERFGALFVARTVVSGPAEERGGDDPGGLFERTVGVLNLKRSE